jgi:hypothetical protein
MYGAEFVAARIATNQIFDLRTTLCYLGVPIEGKSHLFGDNSAVIISSSIPHSSLKKRHNALSFHRVREAISAGNLYFHKIASKLNPSDTLSKHTRYPQAWPILKSLLFWKGTLPRLGQVVGTANWECQDEVVIDKSTNNCLYEI